MEIKQERGSVADQCRALGLKVGDTIEGTEGGQGWWSTARLTLLWLGTTEAAWSVTERSSRRPLWSEPHEAANWTLTCRNWRKVDAQSLLTINDLTPVQPPKSED